MKLCAIASAGPRKFLLESDWIAMMVKVAFRAGMVPWVWMALACGAGDPPPDGSAWAGTREQVGYVEVVRNPDAPLYSEDAVAVERRWAAPSLDEEERMGFWEEPVVVRLGGERVYVLDRMSHRVHVLEATGGEWKYSIGRKGGGPGELERPFGLALSGMELVVGDGGKSSLERFGPEGEYRGSLHLGQLGFSVYALGGESFLVNSLLGNESGWKRLSADGEVVPFAWPDSASVRSSLGTECSRVSAASRTVFRLDCYRPAFQMVSESGDLLREVLMDRPAESTSGERLELHLEHVRETMGQSGLSGQLIEAQLEQARDRFRLNPKMRTVRLNSETGFMAAWEQEPDDLGGGPARLHIFSGTGVYVATIDFAQSWVDFDWSGSMLYALARDPETDLIGLVAHRLILPDQPE